LTNANQRVITPSFTQALDQLIDLYVICWKLEPPDSTMFVNAFSEIRVQGNPNALLKLLAIRSTSAPSSWNSNTSPPSMCASSSW
jgi:hypothetical protein